LKPIIFILGVFLLSCSSGKQAAINNNSGYGVMVERDRSKPVHDSTGGANSIYQDSKKIAYYETKKGLTDDDGNPAESRIVHFSDGARCAVITFKTTNAIKANIITTKDNKTAIITSDGSGRPIFEVALDYLVKNGYL
jgi:hypothetical protein